MRKNNYDHQLIRALLALREMQDPGYDYPVVNQEVFERCSRWLDAMVPPGGYLPEDEP